MSDLNDTRKTYSYELITADELTALDLREEEAGLPSECYRITIYDAAGVQQEPETAEAVRLIDEGRTGIAWGAEAQWGDSLGSIDADVECWLNDNETWGARN